MLKGEYEFFCHVDRVFYDAPYSKKTAGSPFAAAERPLPENWRQHEHGDWLSFDPGGPRLPAQGWKIHVSSTLTNANHVIEKVWDYCISRNIQFKFLRSKSAFIGRVSKYAPRGYSGKLVTIYPIDDAHCERILTGLGCILDGEPSSYILSDVRWNNGPLYVRYGGFSHRETVNERGETVPAIEDLNGSLVPDRREPVFYTPPWVAIPDFLRPHIAARYVATTTDLPYTFDKSLHFSNGGGVYLGTDTRTGKQIVLKEGRPHAGLDGNGNDAIRRLEHEYAMLQKLAGIPGVPEVYDLFWAGEHRFMAMEYVPGASLLRTTILKQPLSNPDFTEADTAAYVDWVLHVHRQVETIIAAIHDCGIVYGDLHPMNILIRDDGTIMLLDYEVAAPIEESMRPGLANPGFAASHPVTGYDIDNYALACIRLALFLPLTSLLSLHRAKVRHLADIIAEYFPVPSEFLTKSIEVIAPSENSAAPSFVMATVPTEWPQTREALVRAIVASATPDRNDRLFPGDIYQFSMGALGLAYGAAGVLYALSATDGYRSEQFDEWLIHRATNSPRGKRIGLYDGLHGAAFTLDHLGYQQEALDTIDICLQTNWEALGPGLFSGTSGIGLSLLHLADRTGEPALRQAAYRAVELVAATPDDTDVSEISGGKHSYAGLFHGRSGQALLLLRAYDDTGDTYLLDRAERALRQDLKRCEWRDDGSLQVRERSRTVPYLDYGSTGIGIVLDQYLTYRHDDQFADASRGIERAAKSPTYILPGLLRGRAGILAYLVGRLPTTNPFVAEQIRNLAWHALPYADGIAFPGNTMSRLSMDLATGTAGVLLSVGMALHDKPVDLPLITSLGNRTDSHLNRVGGLKTTRSEE